MLDNDYSLVITNKGGDDDYDDGGDDGADGGSVDVGEHGGVVLVMPFVLLIV